MVVSKALCSVQLLVVSWAALKDDKKAGSLDLHLDLSKADQRVLQMVHLSAAWSVLK